MAEVNVEKKQQGGGSAGRFWGSPSLFPRSQGLLSNASSLSPFAVMRRFTDDLDRMFSNPPWQGGAGWGEQSWPAVEVFEHDGKLLVRADLPGLNKEDVKVEVDQEGLIIEGERRHEHEQSGRGFYRSERMYGSFRRAIPLPEGANTDQAKANFQNGVLEVSIPVPQGALKGRQIPIEGGTSDKKGLETAQTREPKTH